MRGALKKERRKEEGGEGEWGSDKIEKEERNRIKERERERRSGQGKAEGRKKR